VSMARAEAIAHARGLEPLIREVAGRRLQEIVARRRSDLDLYGMLAAELNSGSTVTATGKRWTKATARTLYWRLQPPLTREEIDFLAWAAHCEGRKLSREEGWWWCEQAKYIGELSENPLDWRRVDA
jgi:hypothetical protein